MAGGAGGWGEASCAKAMPARDPNIDNKDPDLKFPNITYGSSRSGRVREMVKGTPMLSPGPQLGGKCQAREDSSAGKAKP